MRNRLSNQDGFSTVAIMFTLMIASLLAVAAFATANNGTPLARTDQNSKQAYAAAEAGVAFYAYHLSQDPNYWTDCTQPSPAPSPNPLWDGTSSTPRSWRAVPSVAGISNVSAAGTTPNPAEYNIRLLPSPGSVACNPNQADTTFLDPETGTFTIESTGRYRGKYRSVVATFKRKSFVDYLWFTDYETPDPLSYQASDVDDATVNCQKYAWLPAGSSGSPRSLSNCSDQQFITGDVMAGPMHTNDRFYTCGHPQFGQTANDTIEESSPTGYLASSSCGGTVSPDFEGTPINGVPILTFPPSNTSLAASTLSTWNYSGKTHLTFNPPNGSSTDGTVTVQNASIPGSTHTQTRPLPANRLIYVSSTGSNCGYKESQQYTNPATCGDVYVSGTYAKSITVASENDVIVENDLHRTSDSVEMGLIANGFVRIYHPVIWNGHTECDGNNRNATPNDPAGPSADGHGIEVDAAILAVKHSFLVDNQSCGAPLGYLTIDGAIAQKFRGTVGTHSGATPISGYLKAYSYDPLLKYIDPPYFLDPVEASWHVVRETEKLPADK